MAIWGRKGGDEGNESKGIIPDYSGDAHKEAAPKEKIEVKASEVQKTKGTKVSWRPADKVAKLKAPESGRPRWCSPDTANIQKKLDEGWKFINKSTLPSAYKDDNGMIKDVQENSSLGTEIRNREMVAMYLPEEQAKARDEYFRDKTMRRTQATIFMKDEKKSVDSSIGSKIRPNIVID